MTLNKRTQMDLRTLEVLLKDRYKITKFIVNDNIDNLMIKFDCDFAIEFSLWIICDSLNEFGMDKTVKYISQTIENRFMSQIKR